MLIKQENIFQKIFIYNINHCLVVLPTGWAAASQPQNVKQKVFISL